jgi:hypothetical protein
MTRPSLLATVAAGAATVVAIGLLAGPIVGRLAPVRARSLKQPEGAVPATGRVRIDWQPSAEVARVAVEFVRALSADPAAGPPVRDLGALATPELVSALAASPPSGPPSAPSRPLAADGRLRLVEVRTAVLPGAEVPGRAPTARVLLIGRLAGEPPEPAAQPADAGAVPVGWAVPVVWQLDLVATPAGWRVAGLRP